MSNRLNDIEQFIASGSMLRYKQKDTVSFIGASSRFPNEPRLKMEPKMEKVRSLTERYNDMLEKDGLCLSRAQIKSMNMIDLRKAPHTEIDKDIPIAMAVFHDFPERREFVKRVGWLANIPCFKEAVVRVNTFRYVHYKILDVDMDAMAYDVYLHDYIYQGGRYLSGTYGNAHMRFNNDNEEVDADLSSTMLFSELYRIYPQNILGWTNEEMNIWREYILDYADNTQNQLESKYGTDQFFELVKMYSCFISLINYILESNKVSRPKSTASHNSPKPTASDNPQSPKKFTRTVGGLSITSERVPKMPTVKTAIKYRTTSWPTRGHLRTLKSGKIVPVKESTHYRHALKDKATDTPMQQIIKFK